MVGIDVIIFEDEPLVRGALRDLVSAQPGMRVLLGTSRHDQVLALAATTASVLVIQQWSGNRERCVALCRALKGLPSVIRILVYSSDDSADSVVDALCAGVDSYLHRSVEIEVLADALIRTSQGEKVWVPVRGPGVEATSADRRNFDSDQVLMTRREKEVLSLLLRRYRNDEIATTLNLAHQTVKNHVSSVLRKVGANNRYEVNSLLGPPVLPEMGFSRDLCGRTAC